MTLWFGDAVRDLVALMRPRQWAKNLLVVVAPLAAGRLLEMDVLSRVGGAFVVLSAVSSAVYLANDVLDRERDAAHPVKRSRPVAAGRVGVGMALGWSAVLALAGVLGAALLGPPAFVGLVAAYLAIMAVYALHLKHQVVYDLVVIAVGFLVRAVAGGVVTGIPLSVWFLVTTIAAAMFVAAGKRSSELADQATDERLTRPSLSGYSSGYLDFVWTTSAAVAITATAVWAVEVAVGSVRPGLAQASVAPFALAMLRYAWWIDRGEAQAPEQVLRRDRGLGVLGGIWAALPLAGAGAFP